MISELRKLNNVSCDSDGTIRIAIISFSMQNKQLNLMVQL